MRTRTMVSWRTSPWKPGAMSSMTGQMKNTEKHKQRSAECEKRGDFMVKYGMTPMQAIQAATSNAADLLGRTNELGSIKPGKYADLIAVSGDPLADIRLLEK